MINLGFVSASVSRQAGGLFWAMKELGKNLQNDSCHLEVYAGQDAQSYDDLSEWGSVPVNLFKVLGPAAFGYQAGCLRALQLAKFDLLHVHGLWMYPSLAARRWSEVLDRPRVVSPHGMLDAWALQNSGWKKRLAAFAYENANLHGASLIHALNDAEYQAIRDYGLLQPVATIPNGVVVPDLEQSFPDPFWSRELPSGSKVLLYLGRLHPKKGLANLIRAWADCHKRRGPGSEWRLVVAGWDQGSHQVELESLVTGLGGQESVKFIGPLFGADKEASLARADAFILPSLSEGLPVSVLEAWSYCLPVIMTPQCNLPGGFEAGAAIRVESDVASLTHGLERLFFCSNQARLNIGLRGRQLVEAHYSWKEVADKMLGVYKWLLDVGPQPACVSLN